MVALLILPVAILAQLEGSLTLWQSLTVSAFGVLTFLLGFLLQGIGGGGQS